MSTPSLTLANGDSVDLLAVGPNMDDVLDGGIRIARNHAMHPMMTEAGSHNGAPIGASWHDSTRCGAMQMSPRGAPFAWTCEFCGMISSNRRFVDHALCVATAAGATVGTNVCKMTRAQVDAQLLAARQVVRDARRMLSRWKAHRQQEAAHRRPEGLLGSGNFGCGMMMMMMMMYTGCCWRSLARRGRQCLRLQSGA
jgi:hypothetical protein